MSKAAKPPPIAKNHQLIGSRSTTMLCPAIGTDASMQGMSLFQMRQIHHFSPSRLRYCHNGSSAAPEPHHSSMFLRQKPTTSLIALHQIPQQFKIVWSLSVLIIPNKSHSQSHIHRISRDLYCSTGVGSCENIQIWENGRGLLIPLDLGCVGLSGVCP